MKKQDLDTGMVVESRNGKKYRIYYERNTKRIFGCSLTENLWFDMESSIREDLTYPGSDEWDIVKVYAAPAHHMMHTKEYGSLLYKRDEDRVALNSEYNAIIGETTIQVGCQTIPIEKVKEVLEKHSQLFNK